MMNSNIKRIFSYEKEKELDDFYGLKPKQTTYRTANLLPIVDRTGTSDHEWVEINRLAKHDEEFCRLLEDDRDFHHVFWYWKQRGKRWNPHSDYQKEATRIIEESICMRVELVCRQKQYLGKMSLLPEKLKTLQDLANSELGYMVQWISDGMPCHRELHLQIQKAFNVDYQTSTGFSD